MPQPSTRGLDNCPPSNAPPFSKKKPLASPRVFSRNHQTSTALWLAASPKRLRAGISRNYTQRKAASTKSSAASRCPTPHPSELNRLNELNKLNEVEHRQR